MAEEITFKTRMWEKLLTYEQKEKYKNAIRQGYFSDYQGLAWRHDTFYGACIWKHPNRVQVIKRFETLLGHRPGWDDITDDNLRDLFGDLASHYAPNSTKTICAEIAAVIRENDASKTIPSDGFSSILKAKKVPSQAVFLTMDEIRKIRDFTPRTRAGKYVHRLFMIECLTGARMSDCMRISSKNIDESGNTLTYVSQKSKVEVTVPIHKWLRPFLVPSKFDEPTTMSFTTYGRIIKEMCFRCGINEKVSLFFKGKDVSGYKFEFVTSHTGRRSFATNLALKGVSLEQIALLMGHMSGNVPNVSMTQHYIVGKMKIDSKVFELFQAYDKGEPVSDYDEELALIEEEN